MKLVWKYCRMESVQILSSHLTLNKLSCKHKYFVVPVKFLNH